MGEGGSVSLKSSDRPQGDDRVLEVSWPESSLGLSRRQMSRRRDAFRRVAWLPRLGQGAKSTHQESLPFFSWSLGVVCDWLKGEGEARSGVGREGGSGAAYRGTLISFSHKGDVTALV